jgi:hypothetical protein
MAIETIRTKAALVEAIGKLAALREQIEALKHQDWELEWAISNAARELIETKPKQGELRFRCAEHIVAVRERTSGTGDVVMLYSLGTTEELTP